MYRLHKIEVMWSWLLPMNIHCLTCGKEVKSYPSRVGRTKYCSRNCCIGEQSPSWKGNDAKYHAIHKWIRNHKPKPIRCENCNKEGKLHVAKKPDALYTRNFDDYLWLCPSCHDKLDRNMEKARIERNKNLKRDNKGRFTKCSTRTIR